MSCGCPSSPCSCPTTVCPEPVVTKCDLYRKGMQNVWVERGTGPNDADCPGVCMLDTMDDCQVIYTLERDDKARMDLVKVTTDPHLLELAATVPRLPAVEEADAEQAQYNRTHEAGSIPFYALFRGQPPFAQ
jgi:hypothetical protein